MTDPAMDPARGHGQTAPGAAERDLWDYFGAKIFAREARTTTDAPISWDRYGAPGGPGDEPLGDVTGKTVADIGCGTGRNVAHVARSLGAAACVGVDSSPSQMRRASSRHGHLPRLTLTSADATSYLDRHPARFDVIFSVFGALDFSDPCRLLPAIARALRPAGRLVFSTSATRSNGAPANTEVKPVHVSLPLSADGSGQQIPRWTLHAQLWQELLIKHGLVLESLRPIKPPAQTSGPTTNLFICKAASQSAVLLAAAEDNPASMLSALPTGMVAGQFPTRSIQIKPTITSRTAKGES